jgi:hypothetical protein
MAGMCVLLALLYPTSQYLRDPSVPHTPWHRIRTVGLIAKLMVTFFLDHLGLPRQWKDLGSSFKTWGPQPVFFCTCKVAKFDCITGEISRQIHGKSIL